MEITVAKSAGFCFGVNRAIEKAKETLSQENPVYCLGKIVHNKFVNLELQNLGMKIVESIEEVPANSTVILRAHGVTLAELEICRKNNLKVVDTTCPNVEKIHKIVQEYSEKGYEIIIIGNKTHPEVLGTAGWSKTKVNIISELEEIKELNTTQKYCVVSQTTTNSLKNKEMIEELKKQISDIIVFNTVCNATEIRQKEVLELAEKSDYMIVIGDKMSSNSTKLYEISKSICKNTQFIENIDELILNFKENSCKIGITAGASTPQNLIEEVVNAIAK